MDRLNDLTPKYRVTLFEHDQRVKVYNWYRKAKERFRRLEEEGNPSLFYSGTSRLKAEQIVEEGFTTTKAKTGRVGVWFYGVDGISMPDDNAAKRSALRHAKYKALEDNSDLALVSFHIPSEAIILDDPYYAFYTTQPDAIQIAGIQHFSKDTDIDKLFKTENHT